MSPRAAACLLAAACLAAPAAARAQYFGRNKVQYKNLKFSELHTEHFTIYFYAEEAEAARDAARMAERWRARLGTFFAHDLQGSQPIVLYASHPDFEQTNVVEGMIDEGTGGVTEGLRRRVTLPLAASLQETDHVLGHELVHAFQYDILSAARTEGVPLWFIEGMAEYLSLGPVHTQTAMWLRDAVVEDHFPKIQDLDDPKYFPYRFGHALWAYLGGRFGDDIVPRALRALRNGNGLDAVAAIESVTGEKADQLSAEWRAAVENEYRVTARANRAGADDAPVTASGQFAGERLVIGKAHGGGEINIGPALSPDGTRVAFISERGRLSLDLYLADASTGRVITKLVSTSADPHFDSLQFLNSAGTFSPDGARLALATVRRARPVVAVIDTTSGSIAHEYTFDGLGEIFQTTWSPDGRSIAFSAQTGGYTDLYTFSLATGALTPLTHDKFADLQPTWSPDGASIVFVTDRFSASDTGLSPGHYQLASIPAGGGDVRPIATGLGGDAINPQFAHNGQSLLFVSDSSGAPQAYEIPAGGGAARALTAATTGIAGFTPLTPAISAARSAPVAAFSVFRDGGFEIHIVNLDAASAVGPVPQPPRTLPPAQRRDSAIAAYLGNAAAGLPPARTGTVEKYSSKLSLLAAGNQVGVTTSGQFGTYVGGGVALLFSDVLADHFLETSISANGEIADIGGGAQYINRHSRLNWGVFAERSPYITGGGVAQQITDEGFEQDTILSRQTYTSAGALVAYPLSRAARLEFNGGVTHIGFSNTLDARVFSLDTGQQLSHHKTDLGSPDSLLLYSGAAAFVYDTGVFGATGPLLGRRMRLEVQPAVGDLTFTSLTLDARQYVMPIRPITLAGRALHLGRYGAGTNDERLTPLYLGDPALVRGYDISSFDVSDCTATTLSACPEFDRLIGNKVLVFNGEVRAPLVGLFTGRLTYGYAPVDVFGFFDAGTAWSTAFSSPDRRWITSTGAGIRVNAFGFAVLEFAAARPLQRNDSGWRFVFNLRPGF